MAIGTDKDIFGEDTPETIKTMGRPRVNRDLARRLYQAGFSASQVAKRLQCNVKTARRIRRELEREGELDNGLRDEGPDIAQADFDEECKRATGMSFYDWMQNQSPSAYRTIFNFTRRCWEKIWDRPSLVIVKKNPEDNLGDQLCMSWLKAFGEDKKRIRGRKKYIRYIFRFLGRTDLCDRHLRMTRDKDPVSIRRIAELELSNFPIQYDQAIQELGTKYGQQIKTAFKLKTVTQMRTGNHLTEKGLLGIKVGEGASYIVMNGPDECRIHVLEKKNEEWDMVFIPKNIREELWEIYQTRKIGDYLFQIKVDHFRKAFKELTLKAIGRELIPHDARKISVTWLYACGVPLEIATTINVGWRDLNTPRDHYLQLRGILKKSDRKRYADNIPDWFKEGIEEFTKED